jgi:hypothetical protein
MLEDTLNASPFTFPILEVTHIVSFALAIGTIALVNFRLLGLAMMRQSPGKLARDTRWWTLLGLSLAIFSGLLMYATDPDKFYLNISFVFKIAALVVAILYHYVVHQRVAASQEVRARIGTRAKLSACVSIALWMAVVFGGIFIEFVKEGLSFS